MTNLTNAMNKQDNFFNQFKEAARQAEQQRFPGFDEVWQEVENRLDQKKKPVVFSFTAKKWMAAAATVIILLVLGIAILQPEPGKAPQVTQAPKSQSGNRALANSNRKAAQDAVPAEIVKGPRPKPSPTPNPFPKANETTLFPDKGEAPLQEEIPAQETWVKGVVTDVNGLPVAGASVTSEGTNRVMTADSTGTFFLRTKPGDQLAVEAVGFNAGKYKVEGSRDLAIQLKPSMTSLDEVVVVGYAARKKSDLAGSVATIGNQPLMASNNSLNAGQMLQGRAAGVYITGNEPVKRGGLQKRGAPGAGTEVRLRGIASFRPGNEPLYIINGIPANGNVLKSIDPGKIDKIDILKDASATAIYGSRAQNGVVIITTKALTKKEELDLKKFNDQLLKSRIKIEPTPADLNVNEAYNPLVENPFMNMQVSPLSTFSIDVDNASYTNIRRYINNGQKVPVDAVRIEEMINYFRYQYPAPKGDMPFVAHTEYSDAPWNPSHKLLRIALKAKDIPVEQLPAANIVFLLDVSGSMNAPDKLPLLKSSMKVLVDQLRPQDKVSIVVYAGAAGLVLPPTSGTEKETIMQALNQLSAGGSTAGGEGIELAYKTAAENFIKDGNNRVVLATDGDFNVGLQSEGDLQHLIEEKRKTGIFLTCLGFGMGNYKDDRLETLADKGNGNYAYIDNMQEADRFLGKAFKGTVFAVAKDVKLQIEFNPAQVKSYRLIGYENRKLNNEDFVNDKIDAGEMGIGHTVTAFYEIIPQGVNSTFAPEMPKLKYTETKAADGMARELATLKLRYKKPDGDQSTESVQVVMHNPQPLEKASEDFRFATAVAWFGLKLRESVLITEKRMDPILSLARGAMSYDPDGYRAECIRLMEASR